MWKLSYKDKDKWRPFTDKGNTEANAALNGNPGKHTFYIEHIWQNGYKPVDKTTWYFVDVREKSQENREPNGNFNKRAIKIEWSEDPWPDFNFETWALRVPPQPPNATAAPAPAATTATTGGGGGGGANTSMVTEAPTAPTVSETSAGPSTHDPMPTNSDPWTQAKNSQRKDWPHSDAKWQGSYASAWQQDKASNMAGMYGGWHGGQYGGPATPAPGLDNSPAAWPTWPEVQAKKQDATGHEPMAPSQAPNAVQATEQDAIATETPQKVRDAPITQEAMPESQAITQDIIMKAPPPLPSGVKGPPQHPKRAPPVCPIAKSLPQGLDQMGSDDSNSSIDGNQHGSDGSTKTAPLPAHANEEAIASLSEEVARLTALLDASNKAALSGRPIPLPGNW